MKPIEVLMNEHRLIEQVLNCLEKIAEEGARRGDLDGDFAGDAVAFFRTFVHGWHFPREEAYLTWAIDPENAGQSENLRFHDHQRCLGHLHEMEQAASAVVAGDRRGVERFAEHAQSYIGVLMKHNEEEEDRVFPAVARTLSGERESEATRVIQHAEAKVEDRRRLDACIDAAHRLADRFNVPRAIAARTGN